MRGLFLLFVATIWLLIAVWLANVIIKRLPLRWWRWLIGALAFVVLLLLPLADEIVGKRQFERLCTENASIQVDRGAAKGKTVYFTPPSDSYIDGSWVPIRRQRWVWVDATNGQPVVSYYVFHAKGGRLIRSLGILEGNPPLLFKGYCAPGGTVNYPRLFKELDITRIENPARKQGIKK